MSLSPDDLIVYMAEALSVAEEIGPETELFSSGILDSVAMMNIIGFVEEKGGIDVRPADVTLENFDTVQRIVDYVRSEA
jgi:acyl carrier protein